MRTTPIEKNSALKNMIKNKEMMKKKNNKRMGRKVIFLKPSLHLCQNILSKSSTLMILLIVNSTMRISSLANSLT